MTDIELVIKIPDRVYGIIKYFKPVLDSEYKEDDDVKTILIKSILKSVPLPKGHGRLIDADKLNPDSDYEDGIFCAVSIGQIDGAETIVEAESEEQGKEGKNEGDN